MSEENGRGRRVRLLVKTKHYRRGWFSIQSPLVPDVAREVIFDNLTARYGKRGGVLLMGRLTPDAKGGSIYAGSVSAEFIESPLFPGVFREWLLELDAGENRAGRRSGFGLWGDPGFFDYPRYLLVAHGAVGKVTPRVMKHCRVDYRVIHRDHFVVCKDPATNASPTAAVVTTTALVFGAGDLSLVRSGLRDLTVAFGEHVPDSKLVVSLFEGSDVTTAKRFLIPV